MNFLKGTTRRVPPYLKAGHALLKISVPLSTHTEHYYKSLPWDEIPTNLPLQQAAIAELVKTKRCKWFFVLEAQEEWTEKDFQELRGSLTCFWQEHTVLKNYPCPEGNLFTFVFSSPQTCSYRYHCILQKHAFPTPSIRFLTQQLQRFLSSSSLLKPHRLSSPLVLPLLGSYSVVNHQLNPSSLLKVHHSALTLPRDRFVTIFAAEDVLEISISPLWMQKLQLEEWRLRASEQGQQESVRECLESILSTFQRSLSPESSAWLVDSYHYSRDQLYANLKTQDCPFANRQHRKSHLKVRVDCWAVVLSCWAPCCVGRLRWLPVTADQFKRLFELNLQAEDLHPSRFLRTHPQHLTWKCELYQDSIVRPYFSTNNNYKWHLEKSGMGTQKTRQAFAFIRDHPDLSYCWIGPRISFCQNVFQRLSSECPTVPFLLYRTLPYQVGVLQRDPLVEEGAHGPNVVIQYESVWQIGMLRYDVVIVDEITTVLTCVTSSTNKQRLCENARTFQKLLQEADKILFMDADLNSKALSLVEELEKEEAKKGVVFRTNTYRNPDLRKCFIFYMDRPAYLAPDCHLLPSSTSSSSSTAMNNSGKVQFLEDLQQRLLKKQRIVFASGSIKFFEAEVEPMLKQHQIRYKWYKQNSGNDDDLLNVNESWNERPKKKVKLEGEGEGEFKEEESGLQMVAYTNRITVGISYENQDFDHLCIYGCPGSVIPRLLMQMRGRFRWLQDPSISMYIYHRKEKQLLTDFKSLYQHVQSRQTVLADFQSSKKEKWDHQQWHVWNQDFRWVTKQFVYDQLEVNLSRSNFLWETLKQLVHHDDQWILRSSYLPFASTSSSLSSSFGLKLPVVPAEDTFQLFCSWPFTMTPSSSSSKTTAYSSWAESKRARVAGVTLKTKLWTLFASPKVQDRCKDASELTDVQNQLLWSLYQLYQNRSLWRPFYHNWLMLQSAKNPTPCEWDRKFNRGYVFQIGQEFSPKVSIRYRLLYEMVRLLGWQHCRDYTSVIHTKKTFENPQIFPRLEKQLSKYQLIYNTKREQSEPRNVPGVVRKVSRLLEQFSGQTIAPYCVTCAAIRCQPHQKHRIPYEQITMPDGKKLLCYTYKLQPSVSDRLMHQIKQVFS